MSTHTGTHANPHPHTLTPTHTHTHTPTHTHTLTDRQKDYSIPCCTYYTRQGIIMHAVNSGITIALSIRTCTFSAHTHTRAHACTCARKRVRITYTCTHARTHTHTHMHTHIYLPMSTLIMIFFLNIIMIGSPDESRLSMHNSLPINTVAFNNLLGSNMTWALWQTSPLGKYSW